MFQNISKTEGIKLTFYQRKPVIAVIVSVVLTIITLFIVSYFSNFMHMKGNKNFTIVGALGSSVFLAIYILDRGRTQLQIETKKIELNLKLVKDELKKLQESQESLKVELKSFQEKNRPREKEQIILCSIVGQILHNPSSLTREEIIEKLQEISLMMTEKEKSILVHRYWNFSSNSEKNFQTLIVFCWEIYLVCLESQNNNPEELAKEIEIEEMKLQIHNLLKKKYLLELSKTSRSTKRESSLKYLEEVRKEKEIIKKITQKKVDFLKLKTAFLIGQYGYFGAQLSSIKDQLDRRTNEKAPDLVGRTQQELDQDVIRLFHEGDNKLREIANQILLIEKLQKEYEQLIISVLKKENQQLCTNVQKNASNNALYSEFEAMKELFQFLPKYSEDTFNEDLKDLNEDLKDLMVRLVEGLWFYLTRNS